MRPHPAHQPQERHILAAFVLESLRQLRQRFGFFILPRAASKLLEGMAKGKQQQQQQQRTQKVANRHLYARLSYLHHAAEYLANVRQGPEQNETAAQTISPQPSNAKEPSQAVPVQLMDGGSTSCSPASSENPAAAAPLSTYFASHMLSISKKAKVKLSADVKRSICKRCNAVLIPGQSSRCLIENKSKGQHKPWADVFLVTCISCGMEKRYAVGQQRQVKKSLREKPAP